MLDHYSGPRQQSFTNTLKNLRDEIESLDGVLNGIFQNYADYKSLGSKAKRSILPIVGKIMSFMFGTVPESQLEDVRHAINELSKNKLTSYTCLKNRCQY